MITSCEESFQEILRFGLTIEPELTTIHLNIYTPTDFVFSSCTIVVKQAIQFFSS